ncbi:hypothetical protein ACTXT7_006363 [Hymenolepis weldensis]
MTDHQLNTGSLSHERSLPQMLETVTPKTPNLLRISIISGLPPLKTLLLEMYEINENVQALHFFFKVSSAFGADVVRDRWMRCKVTLQAKTISKVCYVANRNINLVDLVSRQKQNKPDTYF